MRQSLWSPTWTPASRPARASPPSTCSPSSRATWCRSSKLVHEAIDQVRRRAHLHPLPAARRRHAAVRAAVRVLLTGAAGFIGTRVGAALRPRVTTSSPSTPCSPRRTGPAPCCPTACSRPTSATPTGWRRCCPVSTWSATRPRWSVPGSNAADAPVVRQPQRLRHHGAARARCTPRVSPGWCWRRRWWSTARAATTARSTAPSTRCRGAAPTSTPACSSTAARSRGEPLSWRLVGEDAPLRPRSLYAASKTAQEHYALAWAEAIGGSVIGAALPQRLRPGHAARHPVFRGRRDLPVRPRKRRAAKGFRGRRPDARLRPRRRRRRGQRRGGASSTARLRRGQRVFGAARSRSWRWPGWWPTRAAARRRWSPVHYRSGDVRHIVADPALRRRGARIPAAVDPADGLREFAFAPLRPDATLAAGVAILVG